MGSLGKSSRSAAAVVMVVLLGICASGVHGALEVRNVLNQTFTVFYPPEQTCCAHCSPGIACPQFCLVCSDVVVKPKGCATLNSRARYPLTYLKVQIVDKYYCAAKEDLKLLTARSLLAVSSVQCGTSGGGLAASVAVISSDRYKACSSSGTINNLEVICLEGC